MYKQTKYTFSKIANLEEQLTEKQLCDKSKTNNCELFLEKREAELLENEIQFSKSRQAYTQWIEQLCSNVRKNVTCIFCNRIFTDPIDLPCSNSICKKHLDDINENKCIFCSQIHEITSGDTFPNERLSQTIASDLYLTEKQRLLKTEIEQLLSNTTSLFKKIQKKEAEIKKFCVNHFAKLESKINLRKQTLNLKIDEIAAKCIDQVNASKTEYEHELQLVLSAKILDMEEHDKLKQDFNEELKSASFPQESFETIKSNLAIKKLELNEKMNSMLKIRTKMDKCSFDSDDFEYMKTSFGHLELVTLKA